MNEIQKSTQQIYERHHSEEREENFSILEKERGVFFKKEIGTGKKVVDLGCRNGVLTKYFIEGNTVTGVDIDKKSLSKAGKLGIDTLHLDLNSDWLELKENSFDTVVLAETLEHLYYPEEVIKRVKKILKPDGMLIGSVPNAFSLKNRLRLFLGKKENTSLNDPTHINHFLHKELESLLEKHFHEVQIIPFGSYSKFDTFWKGMFSFDLVFICKRVMQ